MDVPTYWDGGSQESVCDPSRPAWASYHDLGTAGHDFTFDFTASGTYRIHFYFMDHDGNDPQNDKGIYYLRTTAEVTVNDAARPSVTQIVNDAVDLCRQQTNGSEYDMALWLHDWTLDQLEYDHSLNWCSAESGLTRHQGTCESYQRIYSKLLDAAGIANGRITGNGHTWNAVKIDGKWCQMDLTWDDTSDNWYGDLDQRHLYFGLTDELMAIAHSDHTANHQKDDYAYRSTDLSNNYFVRNGKADEWAEKYADRIQQHLDAKEESFSIDADNQSFPPSISGIQNGIIAYAMNLREWSKKDLPVKLTATSNVTTVSSHKWSAKFDFVVEYQVIPELTYNVTYQAHAAFLGWLKPVFGGEISGTVGQSREIEALRASITSNLNGSIEMKSTSFGRDWSTWTEGETGTTSESRALQAIRIRLTGNLAEEYDVYYCAHVADYGWLDWAKNGEDAGTVGLGKTLQAVKIVLVKKGESAPGNTDTPCIETEVPSIGYSAHVAYLGWQNQVSNGATAGTVNKNLSLEAVRFFLSEVTEGAIKGSAHIAFIGWQSANKAAIGTTGQSLAIEAVTFKLDGKVSEKYKVMYRVHSPYYGWSNWAQDGAIAGTTGLGQATDALELMLISK